MFWEQMIWNLLPARLPWLVYHLSNITPRFTAETLTEDEAATHLQGIWRARVAR